MGRSRTRFARRVGILVACTAVLFSWGSPARANGVVTTGVAVGNGVLVGSVVNLPFTFSMPIQVCNNDIAAGVPGFPPGVLTAGVCVQGG